MSDTTLTDTGLTDLGPFFERYDRRHERLMAVALCVSLILATAIATRLLSGGVPGLRGVRTIWGTGVIFTPLFVAGWWAFGGLMALRRRRTAPLDGSHPAGAVDAGNGMRIANAGFAFNIALMAAMLMGQVLTALIVFGFGHQIPGGWIARAIMMTIGGATIYLGNLWPRMPVSRVPEKKPAAAMKANRFAGWFIVAVGILVFLAGVFMPYISPPVRYAQPPFEPAKHREIALPAAELDRFVGRYDFGNDFVISVAHRGATLWVTREGLPGEKGAPVYPEGPHAFFWKMVEAQLRFTTDADGRVTGAEFREAGPWQPGKRLAS